MVSPGIAGLLADLDRYPEDRPEIVLEIVAEIERAGDAESALAWLDTLTAAGGFEAAVARVELARLHFSCGRDAPAAAELAALRASREPAPEPYEMAAQLYVERGEDRAALRWIGIAVSRYAPEELADAMGEDGWSSFAYPALRRQLRERLGYLADDLDSGLHRPSPDPTDGFPQASDVLAAWVPGSARLIRILVWPEVEFRRAQQRWPQLLDPQVDHEEYRGKLESRMREATRSHPTKIILIAACADAMADLAERQGGTIEDAQSRRAYLREQTRSGNFADWPPARNAPCWCGTAAKYKKCCGAPHSIRG